VKILFQAKKLANSNSYYIRQVNGVKLADIASRSLLLHESEPYCHSGMFVCLSQCFFVCPRQRTVARTNCVAAAGCCIAAVR